MAFLRTLFICLLLSGCSSLLFYPESDHYADPSLVQLPFADEYVNSGGEKLHAWYVPSALQKKKGTILFLHGNAENVSTHFFGAAFLVKGGYDMLAVDYRGFGKSTGSPSIGGVEEDIRSSIDYLYEKNSRKKVIVLAQSIGAALTISALYDHPDVQEKICFLILDSPFESIRQLVREKTGSVWLLWPLWPIQYPVSWMFAENDAVSKVSDIRIDKLFIASTGDKVVPMEHTRELFKEASQPKDFWLSDAGHTGTLFLNEYREKLFKTLEMKCHEKR